MDTLIFYLFGLGLLLVMAFVMWSGVGRKRPELGRGFAVVALGLAIYVGHLAYELIW